MEQAAKGSQAAQQKVYQDRHQKIEGMAQAAVVQVAQVAPLQHGLLVAQAALGLLAISQEQLDYTVQAAVVQVIKLM